jgi:hypothetical protein
VAQIAAQLDRSVGSILQRKMRWGLRRDPRYRAEAMRRRRAQMLKLRATGATQRQIAAPFDLTPQRVQQILKQPSP